MHTRLLASAGTGVACLGVLLSLSSARATNVNAGQAVGVPVRRALPHIPSPSRLRIHRNGATPTPCSSDAGGDGDFVGIPDGNSIAGDVYSAVLGGATNLACAEASGIGAGFSNVDSADGAQSAFIGGGQSNATYQQNDFIGAGTTNVTTGYYAFVGAGSTNTSSGSNAGVVGGYTNVAAGDDSFVGAGFLNNAAGNGSFIGAGDYAYYNGGNSSAPGNQISANDAFIGAGDQNVINGNESLVGAGMQNTVNGSASIVVGGNQSVVNGNESFVGAGVQNTVNADEAFLGGGLTNSIASGGTNGVIAGGVSNYLSGQKSTIGGGESNESEGSFAVVPGGYRNEALGNESLAAGSQAEARYAGSFVWSDYVSSEKPQTDSHAGEFVARASGGVYFFSNAASSAGVHLASGSGAWSSLSDRNAKTDVVPLDDASILAKVAALPVSAWRYKTESGVRHVGPMAQDFYAAFGVGEDDRHITSIDEDGIALAAIKALHQEVAVSNDANRKLRDQNARLASRLTALESDVRALMARRR